MPAKTPGASSRRALLIGLLVMIGLLTGLIVLVTSAAGILYAMKPAPPSESVIPVGANPPRGFYYLAYPVGPTVMVEVPDAPSVTLDRTVLLSHEEVISEEPVEVWLNQGGSGRVKREELTLMPPSEPEAKRLLGNHNAFIAANQQDYDWRHISSAWSRSEDGMLVELKAVPHLRYTISVYRIDDDGAVTPVEMRVERLGRF